MGQMRIDPRTQFSKRLARWTAWFWFLYMTWLSVVMILQPKAALYTVYMGVMVTVVMMLNVWAYTKNSVYEKSMLAMLDKTKMEISIGGKAKDGDGNEETVEEGGNG
jgi:hypothetical protein